ncbi:MAG: methionine adenosyltransferase [Muribaculaceae bacterium]|nr:methionine adenosyltransferase [Bacteroidales bacterium]MDY2734193.1 methionine adenosyltransferase [Muribaculaceae bacterium]MDY5388549.1 methionine adenosyltransferase [Muribaculaceae bacterium]
MSKNYLFTSESVSEGHPDKVADQISDCLLDQFLARDPQSHVAIESMVTTGQVVVAGEVTSKSYVDVNDTIRELINNIGYNRGAYRFDGDSCGILSCIHEQSADINRGVNRKEEANKSKEDLQGAGDQGMMFGYAVNETEEYMPLTLSLSHRILLELAAIRREGKEMTYYRKGKLVTYLRPDAKSQVTVEYGPDRRPVKVRTIVVSTQHDEFVAPLDASEAAQLKADQEMLETIRRDVKEVLMPRVIARLPESIQALFADGYDLFVNPTGKFVIGGPHGDTGLTGRKIIVDTYGGRGAHGGGAFSGKDPSKVDRSAAYACRHIAKNMVAAGVADEMLVQVAYAIGEPRPVSIFVDTYGTNHTAKSDAEIADAVNELFDMRPRAIEERLKLREPIYLETAAYGHVGRQPEWVEKKFRSRYENEPIVKRVELFTWEKLDMVDKIKEYFGL